VNAVVTGVLQAYAARFPDEESVTSLPAMPIRCAAIVRDDEGRVLQRRDDGANIWLFPMETPTDRDESLPAVAVRAVAVQMGLVGVVEAEPTDIATGPDGLLLSYVVTVGDIGDIPADVARSSRWAPWDTIFNERLGRKLAGRPPS
jgi:hypothetical protein